MAQPLSYPFKYLGRYLSAGQPVHCYSFVSPLTREKYIVHFEIFPNDFYGMKFYLKRYSSQRNRYKMLTNLGEARAVFRTCAQIARDFYHAHPECSLGIVGENKVGEIDSHSAYLLINRCQPNQDQYVQSIIDNILIRYPNTEI